MKDAVKFLAKVVVTQLLVSCTFAVVDQTVRTFISQKMKRRMNRDHQDT